MRTVRRSRMGIATKNAILLPNCIGMFDNLMNKLQDMQQHNETVKAQLATQKVIGEAQGIQVTANGNRLITDIRIPSELLVEAEAVQDLVVLATNRALEQAKMLHDQEMAKAARGLLEGMEVRNPR